MDSSDFGENKNKTPEKKVTRKATHSQQSTELSAGFIARIYKELSQTNKKITVTGWKSG